MLYVLLDTDTMFQFATRQLLAISNGGQPHLLEFAERHDESNHLTEAVG